jgi:hypothetical protein
MPGSELPPGITPRLTDHNARIAAASGTEKASAQSSCLSPKMTETPVGDTGVS